MDQSLNQVKVAHWTPSKEEKSQQCIRHRPRMQEMMGDVPLHPVVLAAVHSDNQVHHDDAEEG